jgi:amidase
VLTFSEYDRMDAIQMAGLIKQRSLSAAEIIETAIARAEVVNVALNAVIFPLYEQARAQSKAPSDGPFAGVPFLIKDFGSRLAGTPHTSGSRALRSYIPDQDDELVSRWKRGGLIPLGKTNAPEFALMAVTEPDAHGPTRNPWDLARTPGGSSGGSAAAVAGGIVPVASAGDGGGSIRIPASCCGLFGLKPSRGRVPSGTLSGEAWQGASVEHVLTRSVRDSAALLDWEQGPDVGAPFHIPSPERPYLEELERGPGQLRVGYSVQHPLGGRVDDSCRDAVLSAAALLQRLGHIVEEVALPFDGPALARDYFMMYYGETGATLADLARTLGRPVRPDDVEPTTWLLGLLGRTFSAADFAASRRNWNVHARQMGRFHATYDLLLTPTMAVLPPLIGETAPTPFEQRLMSVVGKLRLGRALQWSGLVERLAVDSLERTPYTQIANLTGLPAMSVPLYWSAEGLPIGVQFIAGFAGEGTLFRLAAQLEVAQPWFGRRPSSVSALAPAVAGAPAG